MSDSNHLFTLVGDHLLTTGDIITVGAKRYKVQKVTTTAVAVTRYFWWDSVLDWLRERLSKLWT